MTTALLDSLLSEHDIEFKRFDHSAVETVAQAQELEIDIPGLATKNLFLRDGKGKRHWLWVGGENEQVNLEDLADALGIKRVSLASSERLAKHLKSEPGRVSILDILNADPQQVTLLITRAVDQSDQLQCHPYENTATLAIDTQALIALLKERQITLQFLD